MAHYFLHRRSTAGLIEDREGAEFRDLQSAIEEAVQAAREMLSEKLLRGLIVNGDRIEICTADGDKVGEVLFKDVFNVEDK